MPGQQVRGAACLPGRPGRPGGTDFLGRAIRKAQHQPVEGVPDLVGLGQPAQVPPLRRQGRCQPDLAPADEDGPGDPILHGREQEEFARHEGESGHVPLEHEILDRHGRSVRGQVPQLDVGGVLVGPGGNGLAAGAGRAGRRQRAAQDEQGGPQAEPGQAPKQGTVHGKSSLLTIAVGTEERAAAWGRPPCNGQRLRASRPTRALWPARWNLSARFHGGCRHGSPWSPPPGSP